MFDQAFIVYIYPTRACTYNNNIAIEHNVFLDIQSVIKVFRFTKHIKVQLHIYKHKKHQDKNTQQS